MVDIYIHAVRADLFAYVEIDFGDRLVLPRIGSFLRVQSLMFLRTHGDGPPRADRSTHLNAPFAGDRFFVHSASGTLLCMRGDGHRLRCRSCQSGLLFQTMDPSNAAENGQELSRKYGDRLCTPTGHRDD